MATALSIDSVGADGRDTKATTIGMLTDNVLLEIFDHYRKSDDQYRDSYCVWQWQLLAHVCRRWRQIIFASPRRLVLQLLCKSGTPVRKNLGIWPVIPIVIEYWGGLCSSDEDNAIAALEHPERVCRVTLFATNLQLGKIAALLQEPFPLLTHFSISSGSDRVNAPVLPGGFLGGCALSLRQFELCGTLFPALPAFLLSASNLVELSLRYMPPRGYISPETLVTHVAVLLRLEILDVEFTSYPDIIPSPPTTLTILPTLQSLSFTGDSDYLEDFVARIDTPRLNFIAISYWDQDIDFVVPQLSQFITRSESLKKILTGHCQVVVDYKEIANLRFSGSTSNATNQWDPETGISICVLRKGIDSQISHLTTILGWMSPLLSDVVHLAIDAKMFIIEDERLPDPEDQPDDLDIDVVPDNVVWLQLLRQFPSVETLFASENVSYIIREALKCVEWEMNSEVLPALDLLCLEDLHVSCIQTFIADRSDRLDEDHPVTFVRTKKEFEKRLNLYL